MTAKQVMSPDKFAAKMPKGHTSGPRGFVSHQEKLNKKEK
jgi:hypothetical protein